MEMLIELNEAEVYEVAGGSGTVSFSFSDTASGTTAGISGTVTISTTASSANLSGSFSSTST